MPKVKKKKSVLAAEERYKKKLVRLARKAGKAPKAVVVNGHAKPKRGRSKKVVEPVPEHVEEANEESNA